MAKIKEIREMLNVFDRGLADSIRPLSDIEDRDMNESVIDHITLGDYCKDDIELLVSVIDKIQI